MAAPFHFAVPPGFVNQGRLDQLVIACAHRFFANLEQAAGVPLWESGIRQVVETAVAESPIPKQPVTPVDLARFLGILGPAPASIPGAAPEGK